MYQVDSSKFTSKPDPKQEFIRYFKDSGAAAALQKAMILLYKMPVKPTDLAEYFSQYFENGAQGLMRISLLKAELCYKRDELQNRVQKIKESESRIHQIRSSLNITEDEFNEIFSPTRIKEKYRLSILERYFKDMEKGLDKTLEEVTEEMQKKKEKSLEEQTENDEYGSNYDSENDCLRDVQSDHAIRQDIKDLDPWGIICKVPKDNTQSSKADKWPKIRDHSHHHHHHGHGNIHSVKSDISLLMETEGYADEDHEPDDDDVTLAELFHQASHEWSNVGQDEEAIKLHNQLLKVKKADNIKMSDFMGWTPLQSRENLHSQHGSTEELQDETPHLQKSFKTPVTVADLFDGTLDDREVDSLKRRPCYQKMMELLKSKQQTKSPSGDAHSLELDTDAFLFDDDDDLEHVYKMMESARHSFDYEFSPHSRDGQGDHSQDHEEEICVPVCSVSDVGLVCSNKNSPVECPCGEENCTCTPPASQNASLGFLPGKMINWTHEFPEYPCPSIDEYGGEVTEGMLYRKAQCDKQQASVDTPFVRMDNSCHCLLSGAYSTGELLGEFDDNDDQATGTKKLSLDQPSVSSNDDDKHTTGGFTYEKKDETTNTEADLERELDQVFKQKRKSSVTSLKAAKSWTKGAKSKSQIVALGNDGDDTFYATDVFGIDLAKEIKRDILGYSPSELYTTTKAVVASTVKRDSNIRASRGNQNQGSGRAKSPSKA